ncbi:MAG: hypothetical protein GY842_22830 [bacterium]|nr:hypothetical protein [bacterium]
MCDWTEYDVTRIPEADFPVRCVGRGCGYVLTGLGGSGRCPACAQPFDRRRLLWDTYGPEAFATPPIIVEDPAETHGLRAVIVSSLTTVLVVGAPLAVVMESARAYGVRGLIAGLFLAALVHWGLDWIVQHGWPDDDGPAMDADDPEATE